MEPFSIPDPSAHPSRRRRAYVVFLKPCRKVVMKILFSPQHSRICLAHYLCSVRVCLNLRRRDAVVKFVGLSQPIRQDLTEAHKWTERQAGIRICQPEPYGGGLTRSDCHWVFGGCFRANVSRVRGGPLTVDDEVVDGVLNVS